MNPSYSTLLASLLALAGCARPAPTANPHFVLGAAWQAEGVWHYPALSFDLTETGLASVYGANAAKLTTDGEVFDPTALTAAHPILQLPAILRLTNLETGLQLRVRVNDRGPANPGRVLAVTPRVAALLEFPPGGVARVRLEVLQAESREAAETVQGGNAARLEVATAPRQSVQQETLPPPQGTPASGRPEQPPQASGTGADTGAVVDSIAVPRLAEIVTRVAPEPGRLWLRLGRFSRSEFARMQLVRVAHLGAEIETVRNGRVIEYRVNMGPYGRVADADAALGQVIAAGITDGQIVIE